MGVPPLNWLKLLAGLCGLLVQFILLAGVLSSAVQADDIDVYGVNGRGPGARLPNVLFVFDTSASMQRTTDGSEGWSSTDPSKLSILHTAARDMLDASEGRINVGIISFNSTAQGIKWPVSSLDQPASDIDPAIGAGVTVKGVLNSIISHDPSGGSTATVDALYEAARYFRGEAVWISGHTDPYAHRPGTWDSALQRYTDGSNIAAHPASYSPVNAHQRDAVTVPGSEESCHDYTVGGTIAGATNHCDGLILLRCDAPSESTRVWDPDYCGGKNATYQWTCTRYDATGSECIEGQGSCSVNGGYTGSDAHQKCYYTGASYSIDSWDGATYQSPIGQSCQANFIVLLSDGAPSENRAKSLVQDLTQAPCELLSDSVFNVPDGSYHYGDCGPELSRYLYDNDQRTSITRSRVTTYTIGFGLGGPGGLEAQSYLKLLAAEGGGDFLLADDSDELTEAFDRIVGEITGGSETNSGLAVDVNRAIGSHRDEAYLNLFQPSARQAWVGNLKGYYLRNDGLHDQLDQPATEPSEDGIVLKATAQSFWSQSPDGDEVKAGGANELIARSQRRLFSDLYAGAGGFALAAPENRLAADNTLLLPEMFGPGHVQTDVPAMLHWLDSANMGDPLHSQPTLVRYSDRTVLYSMTNQGFMHALDVSVNDPGPADRELFAFMPQRLLVQVPALMANSYTGEHIYGLDGTISRWHDDSVISNGLVDKGEKVTLFFGMRRGGNAYFALDVSDPDAPVLKWTIDTSSPGFGNLGQSWSRMSLVTMPWQGSTRSMLVFGGGYDPLNDENETRQVTGTGNAIYFADPETGELLWSVSASGAHSTAADMQYSIPSDLRIIDVDGNGVADRIYVGDLGGQLWRLKFDDASFGNSSGLQVTLLAELADDTLSGGRRFFYPPTAYHSTVAAEKYLGIGIGIGTGNRPAPLSQSVQDRVYALRDRDVSTELEIPLVSRIVHSQLVDQTIPATDLDQLNADLQAGHGWYFNLGFGEKALSQIVAFEGQLLFTTYAPSLATDAAAESLQCSVGASVGRFYTLNQSNATAGRIIDQSSGTNTEVSVKSVLVQGDGIPGSPVIVFPEGQGAVDIYVDKSKVGTIDQQLKKIFWHAK